MSAQAMAIFLRAVALVETGGNAAAVGRHGERGEFAMIPAVVATCGGYGQHEAEKHARWLERQLLAEGISAQPFNLALAWNAGFTAVRQGRAPVASYDYAVRVRNLYTALERERETLPARPVAPVVFGLMPAKRPTGRTVLQ